VSALILTILFVAVTLSIITQVSVHRTLRDPNSAAGTIWRSAALAPGVAFGIRTALALVAVACTINILFFGIRSLSSKYWVLWLALLLYSCTLAFKGLTYGDLFSSAVYSPMAPVAVFVSALIFIGARAELWLYVARVIALGSLIIAALTIVEAVLLTSTLRGEAFGRLYVYSSFLEVSAIIAVGWFRGKKLSWLGWLPLTALAVAGVALQTRLVLLEVICLVLLYSFIGKPRISRSRIILSGLLCVAGLAVIGLSLSDSMASSAGALWERRSEDSRSSQIPRFFARIDTEDLWLGIGIPKDGVYNGQGWDGIDIGYINILYLAGAPGLALFFLLHLLPSVLCSLRRLSDLDRAAVVTVLTYSIRLCSSTVPNLEPQYLVLLLIMGRCAYLQGRCAVVRSNPMAPRTPLLVRSACLRSV
jgi:hypothetical protein